MSSKAVRDAVKQGWASRLPDVPFFDTVNTTPGQVGLPELWVTFIFEGQRDRLTIGGTPACYREVGTIAVVIMSKSGTTDAGAGVLADRIADEFIGFVGAGGYMEITNVQSPNDGSNDNPPKSEFYNTIVEMDYRYDTYT